MNNWIGVQIIKQFAYGDIAKSALTAFIFYVLIGGIFVVPTIMISLLYVPFMVYFMLGIFIVLAFTANFGLGIFVKTLKHYNNTTELDYDTFVTRTSIVIAIVTFVIIAIIYIQYLE